MTKVQVPVQVGFVDKFKSDKPELFKPQEPERSLESKSENAQGKGETKAENPFGKKETVVRKQADSIFSELKQTEKR